MERDEAERGRYRGAIPSWSIRHPIGTIMLGLLVLGGGVLAAVSLPLDLLPKLVYPSLNANVTNPGVDPEVMEETVAKPLETALAITEGLERLESNVSEGRVNVSMTFRYGTNMNFALQDAAKNLERARGRLPEEADPATINKFDPSQIAVFDVAFSSDRHDLVFLRNWVEERLRPQLLLSPGVASVDVSGGLIREIQVILDQERLRSYGLTVSQIIEAIRANNQDVASGRVSSATREVVSTTEGKFRNVDDIRRILLQTAGGARVPLTEVARVEDTHQEQRLWSRLGIRDSLSIPAVRLSVRKQPEANTVSVAEGVVKRLEGLQGTSFVPEGVTGQELQNQAKFIRNSIHTVQEAALLGAILSMLVVFIFLRGIRKTLIIGTAIPLAILATFALMKAADVTLNIMSLGGLALGVGMLVDNSIVMLENIFRKREQEGVTDPEEAAEQGAGQVQSAIIASTATHLAAVVPFLIISGLAAMIFRELILTISFAILASLFVALTLVPMLSAQLSRVKFSSGTEHWRILLAFDSGLDRFRDWYRRAAAGAIRMSWAVMLLSVLALLGTFLLTRNLGSEFLPQVDDGGVGVNINVPPGGTPDQTNRIAVEVEEIVRGMPDVVSVFATAGGMGGGPQTQSRSGNGSLDIRLTPASERELSAASWVANLQAKLDERGFAGARVNVRPPRIRGLRTSASGSDIALSVQGEEIFELRRIADDITNRVRGVPGLSRLEASVEAQSPQLGIELDRERAAHLGLNVGIVGQTIRTALDGTVATRYTEGNRQFDVRVKLPRSQFTNTEDLASVALFPGSRGSAPVYLRDVATVFPSLGPTTIQRENQTRLIRLTGDALTEIAPISVVNDSIKARLATLEIPQGYTLVYGGEEEAIRENNKQLAIVVILSVFLVFVVLAVKYESLLNPLIIIVTIPLSLVGVGVTLAATGTLLSAPVLLGVIMLAGIVVNNAILMVEYAEQYRRDAGKNMVDAVVEAGSVRMRPILMTTLTTCLGMMPLALGLGEGSELMQPLAIAVVGGLSIATLLTLFVVPCAYVMVHRAGDRLKTWITGKPSGDLARAQS